MIGYITDTRVSHHDDAVTAIAVKLSLSLSVSLSLPCPLLHENNTIETNRLLYKEQLQVFLFPFSSSSYSCFLLIRNLFLSSRNFSQNRDTDNFTSSFISKIFRASRSSPVRKKKDYNCHRVSLVYRGLSLREKPRSERRGWKNETTGGKWVRPSCPRKSWELISPDVTFCRCGMFSPLLLGFRAPFAPDTRVTDARALNIHSSLSPATHLSLSL